MPSPSNATPLPLRCAAMLCPCTANQSRALPLLSAAMHPICLAMHCHARASPNTAFAVPIIATAPPCPAEPPLRLAPQCWAILCRHRAFPSLAAAAPCHAKPPLCLPPQCHRFPALRPAFALQCQSTPLRRPPLPRIADAFLVNPSPDRAALGHASPAQCLTLPPPVRASLSHCRALFRFACAARGQSEPFIALAYPF